MTKQKIKALKEQDRKNIERGIKNIASVPSQTPAMFDLNTRKYLKKVGK